MILAHSVACSKLQACLNKDLNCTCNARNKRNVLLAFICLHDNDSKFCACLEMFLNFFCSYFQLLNFFVLLCNNKFWPNIQAKWEPYFVVIIICQVYKPWTKLIVCVCVTFRGFALAGAYRLFFSRGEDKYVEDALPVYAQNARMVKTTSLRRNENCRNYIEQCWLRRNDAEVLHR